VHSFKRIKATAKAYGRQWPSARLPLDKPRFLGSPMQCCPNPIDCWIKMMNIVKLLLLSLFRLTAWGVVKTALFVYVWSRPDAPRPLAS
jgi:hypothetical protein